MSSFILEASYQLCLLPWQEPWVVWSRVQRTPVLVKMIAICTVPVYCASGTEVHSTVPVQRSVAQRLRVNQVHHSLPCTNQVPRTLLKVGSISICHCQSLIDDRILGSNSKHFNILLSVSHPVPTNFSRLLYRRGAPSVTFRNFLEYFRKYQTSMAAW